MSKRRVFQSISIFFLLISVILTIPNTNWTNKTSLYAFIALILGTLSSIISLFIPTSYVFHFNENDWRDLNNEGTIKECTIKINAKKHGMGKSPKCEAFLLNDSLYEVIGVDFKQDGNGNIDMNAVYKFSGKVIVS